MAGTLALAPLSAPTGVAASTGTLAGASAEDCADGSAAVLVLVAGGLPEGSTDLRGARERVRDAIGELAPDAAAAGVTLAIEPLHPMYAADRCAVSTLDQALEIAERFPAEQVGVVVDTYHVWWDDRAPAAVARAGAAGRLHSFQLADWTTPLPAGVLNGRGQLGDGVIDLRAWCELAAAAGHTGPVEVELFNDELWGRDGVEVLEETLKRFTELGISES